MKPYDPTQPSRGLFIAGSKEATPPSALRRARGIHSILTSSIKSRWGSTALFAVTAHSLYRYADVRFQGVEFSLYRNGVEIDTGYDGSRLAFVRMKPSPDVEFGGTQTGAIKRQEEALGSAQTPDYLFCAGGGRLRKVDSAGAVSNWGIVAPIDGFTATKQAVTFKTIESFEDATTFTAITATLADEASIKQEGVNSLKMTVAASAIGQAHKAITTDLNQFSGTVESSLEDFITIWVRVDNPSNTEYLQIIFDVEDATFDVNTFSVTIPVLSDILPAKQLVEQTIGIGASIETSDFDYLIARDSTRKKTGEYKPLTDEEFTSLLTKVSQGSIVLGQNLWTKLRIPKRLFNQSGPTSRDWGDVKALKVIVKATSRTGGVIAYWDIVGLEGGTGLQGTYKYRETFLNSTTGSRSNANPSVIDVVAENVTRQSVRLMNFAPSLDPQVDQREIWRTTGGGAAYFRVAAIDINLTEYIDTASDFAGMNSVTNETTLESLELPLDNDPPEATFDDAVEHNGQMWWCRDSVEGTKGRVYYSPIGRPEAVLGFIYAGSDDDPTQKLVVWNEQLFCFVESRIKRILGVQEPFTHVEIFGAPGTLWPHTVVATPYGILYRATDGIRLFNGAHSMLVDIESIYPILRGEAAENLTAFAGVVACYARSEYLISDGESQMLAHNLADKLWRDVGVGPLALDYEEDTGEVIASFNSKVVILEDEGVTAGDDGDPIAFAVEFPAALTMSGQLGVVQILYMDINTNGQLITPTLICDSTEIVLPVVVTAAKTHVEIPINRSCRIVALRLEGQLTARVEIFQVEMDVHLSANTSAAA